MKEYTVTMNAQITYIFQEERPHMEEWLKDSDGNDIAKSIKNILKCDDVVVSDMKLFIMDKKEESHETYE